MDTHTQSRAVAFAEQEEVQVTTVICQEHQVPLEGLPGKLRPGVCGPKPATATYGCSRVCVHMCTHGLINRSLKVAPHRDMLLCWGHAVGHMLTWPQTELGKFILLHAHKIMSFVSFSTKIIL